MSCVSHRYRNSRSRVRGASYRRSLSRYHYDPCKKRHHSKCKPDPCEKKCKCKDWDRDWCNWGKDDWDHCRWWGDFWKHCYHDPCRDWNDWKCRRPEFHHNIPRCYPRSGQLIRNGGFEDPIDPFRFWVTNEGVQSIVPPEKPHEGKNAASLDIFDPPGWLYQDVPGVCHCRYFLLSFSLSRFGFFSDDDDDNRRFRCGNARVRVQLEFLDAYKCVLGRPALDLEIPVNSLYPPYHTFVYVTSCASPRDAHFARVSFAVHPGFRNDEDDDRDRDRDRDRDGCFRRDRILLDDVSLVAVDDD